MLRQRSVLLHRLPRRCFLLAAFLALFCLSIEILRHGCGAADIAYTQDLDLKFAALVSNAQHVANVDITSGFGLYIVRMDTAEVTGLRCQSARFEKARGPQPLVDANGDFWEAGHQLYGSSGVEGFDVLQT